MRRDPLIRRLRRFLRNERGATAIEYAIIAAGIAAVLVGVIATLGGKVADLWTAVVAAFN
jgi:pilus assembly protein Flp/PilA